eukprot:1382858-Rhodomonas_salina.2
MSPTLTPGTGVGYPVPGYPGAKVCLVCASDIPVAAGPEYLPGTRVPGYIRVGIPARTWEWELRQLLPAWHFDWYEQKEARDLFDIWSLMILFFWGPCPACTCPILFGRYFATGNPIVYRRQYQAKLSFCSKFGMGTCCQVKQLNLTAVKPERNQGERCPV